MLLAALVSLAVGSVLYGERTGERGWVIAAKPIASAAFVALGWSRFEAGDVYGARVLAALGLCAVGDVLLIFPRAFRAGLVAFLLAHLGYATAFTACVPLSVWPVVPLALVAACSATVTAWLWPRLGRMRFPVLAYIVAITTMMWGALAVASVRGALIPIGAALFYLSDLAVARDRFVRSAFANRAWGLPAYYLGQFLLALSVGR